MFMVLDLSLSRLFRTVVYTSIFYIVCLALSHTVNITLYILKNLSRLETTDRRRTAAAYYYFFRLISVRILFSNCTEDQKWQHRGHFLFFFFFDDPRPVSQRAGSKIEIDDTARLSFELIPEDNQQRLARTVPSERFFFFCPLNSPGIYQRHRCHRARNTMRSDRHRYPPSPPAPSTALGRAPSSPVLGRNTRAVQFQNQLKWQRFETVFKRIFKLTACYCTVYTNIEHNKRTYNSFKLPILRLFWYRPFDDLYFKTDQYNIKYNWNRHLGYCIEITLYININLKYPDVLRTVVSHCK